MNTNSYIDHLPFYGFAWPCSRISDLRHYGWDSVILRMYAASGDTDIILRDYDKQPTVMQSSNVTRNDDLLYLHIHRVFTPQGVNGRLCMTDTNLNLMLPVIEHLGRQAVSKEIFRWLYVYPAVSREYINETPY